jgi:glycosyltransferase involved in cell wall biosynthesis
MNIFTINTLDRKGGAAEVAWSIKTELEKEGHLVNLFVGRKNSNDKFVKAIPYSRIIGGLVYLAATDIDFWMSDKILDTEEFRVADVVHCHNLHGNYFKLATLEKIAKLKPVVWTFHDMWPITPHCAHAFDGRVRDGFFQCPSLNTYQKILWHNEKYLSRKKKSIYDNSSFHIVVPSLWLKEKVSQSTLSEKPIHLIPNGIDTSIFFRRDKSICRKKHNLPQNKKIILFVAAGGKNNEWKGWKYTEAVISHFQKNEECVLVCIGGDRLEKKTSNGIIYIPYVEDKNILSEYFSSADVFLFTSIAENFPLVVLEAMGSGTPVVSFDVGGVKEAVIHRENGYISEYKNSKDLICGVEYIFSLSLDEIQKMSDHSARRVKDEFSLQIMADKYLKLYKSIIKKE